MNLTAMSELLWGDKARLRYLLIASLLLLFTLLGAREIWTQEHRWADIVLGMFYRQDFLHPYLGNARYYDKPLLSYWLIVFFAKVTHTLSIWTLRLPSALSGLLTVLGLYYLGATLKNKQLGFLSAWLLLTTFYFVFWARISSADMLNLAGSVWAIAWYISKRNSNFFSDYLVFFLIIAVTALCKGLVGVIVPMLAVLTDIGLQKSWRKYLHFNLFLAMVPALIIYLLPFWASTYFGGENYGQNGLYLVYRENILRYFQPFDHRAPIYVYFIYLPVYLLPWTFFFIPALVTLKSRWSTLTLSSKWIVWTVFILFMFFTLSGSRRSYYVLPIVPFAILLIADWMLSDKCQARRNRQVANSIILSFFFLFLSIDLLPAWFYSEFGINRFANDLQSAAVKIKPWNTWNVVMLGTESKLNFYLQLSPNIKTYGSKGNRSEKISNTLALDWPILKNKPVNTIFISRKRYAGALKQFFPGYQLIELPDSIFFLKAHDLNSPIAFIPPQSA